MISTYAGLVNTNLNHCVVDLDRPYTDHVRALLPVLVPVLPLSPQPFENYAVGCTVATVRRSGVKDAGGSDFLLRFPFLVYCISLTYLSSCLPSAVDCCRTAFEFFPPLFCLLLYSLFDRAQCWLEQVVGHMHAFLQRPAVAAVLEGSTPPAAVNPDGVEGVASPARVAVAGSVPRGEVLPRTPPLAGTEDTGERCYRRALVNLFGRRYYMRKGAIDCTFSAWLFRVQLRRDAERARKVEGEVFFCCSCLCFFCCEVIGALVRLFRVVPSS